MKHIRLALIILLALPLPVLAQETDNQQAMERMDQMEQEIQLLQKQVAREPAGSDSDSAPITNAAQLEVRLSAIQNELRELRGKTEENNFQVKKLSDALEKMQKDTDFRFNELSAAKPGAAINLDAATKKPLPDNAVIAKGEAPPAQTTAGDGVLRAPASNGDDNGKKTEFATPREHYNYAFRLLNQTQYEDAATSFAAFAKKYPKDPLIGNAYYWEGETYYIRRDYVNAADNFRQGFEALPDGPKAADNLLKLSMSLDALNRDKEACVVLEQILTKFKKNSTSVTEKADQERKRIGCQ